MAPDCAQAHIGALPPSLKDVEVPQIPGLLDGANPIVTDKAAAIVLGKALFWDMNLGSDGQACATCHFHASVDSRSRNQVSVPKAKNFDQPNAFALEGPGGPNFQLTAGDFPLYKFDDATSPPTPLFTDKGTTNVISSAGTYSGKFKSVNPKGEKNVNPVLGSEDDVCEPFTVDGDLDQYHVGGVRTRHAEPRNAPAFNNSVLFDRNFWDGRANFYFNGVTPFGARDKNAWIWVYDGGALMKTRLMLPNASLASLATGPGLNIMEMSCQGRTWPDVARKLLKRRALERQTVHPDDSALGEHAHQSGKGLNKTYEQLIKTAFNKRYWAAGTHPQFGKPGYGPTFNQMERNFSMFVGLAIQLYGETQISDDTPFDQAKIVEAAGGEYQDANGVLTHEELQGFQVFNDAHCIICHTGPIFSTATNRKTYYKDGDTSERALVTRIFDVDSDGLLFDIGFFNNGSSPDANDPGVGGVDDFGNPLSFARQFRDGLRTNHEFKDGLDPLPATQACRFNAPFAKDQKFPAQDLVDDPAGNVGCADPTAAKIPNKEFVENEVLKGPDGKMRLGVSGAFKVPQLYNIELTGPYFHNGGAKSLVEVVDQYFRKQNKGNGGNFTNEVSTLTLLPDASSQGLTLEEKKDRLIAFLKTLTDERVRYEQAPFDHPELLISNGNPGDHNAILTETSAPYRGVDEVMRVPAVGRYGRTLEKDGNGQNLPALKSFEELLQN